jgi:hypothetical protein
MIESNCGGIPETLYTFTESEFAKYTQRISKLESTLAKHLITIAELTEKVERYEKALKVYANEDNWAWKYIEEEEESADVWWVEDKTNKRNQAGHEVAKSALEGK